MAGSHKMASYMHRKARNVMRNLLGVFGWRDFGSFKNLQTNPVRAAEFDGAVSFL